MKSFGIILLLTGFPGTAFGGSPDVVGKWQFYKKVYQGQEMPEGPSAPLRMYFEFDASGNSSLYWWHEGDRDHCARKGRYLVNGDLLQDEVTWVDPKNTPECADDMDMQLGRKTKTPFYFRGADLAIRFQIAGEPLDLVWKKTEPEGK
ncbi:MAG: hypothetical protein ACXVCG_01760 [Bdellovibrionota bacterium]